MALDIAGFNGCDIGLKKLIDVECGHGCGARLEYKKRYQGRDY
jgi:hypothetical protein